jgi:IclR family pca regulon transcriptional regulator
MAMQEAGSVGVLDGDDVIAVAAVTAGRVVSSTLQPGTRVPAYCTANGRVLTAWLPESEREAWIARQTMPARTVQTLTDRDRLREELARVRAQGHALVDQEFEPGLRTVAVPLRNRRGEVVASMNVSVHAARVSIPDLLDRCLPMLLQAQEQLKPLL